MNRTRHTVAFATLACLFAGCSTAPAAEPGTKPDLYDRVHAASIELLVDGRLSGSGWFADAEGLFITAAHAVVGQKGEFEVITGDGARLEAKLEAIDLGHDIALMRVKPRDGGFPTLPIAEKMPAPTSAAYLFGAPQFRHALLVRGSIARAAPEYEYYGNTRVYVRIYHVSAPSPHGTSGGCWVDPQGRVIGNQSGLMLHNGAGNGLAFVAPTDAIKRLVSTRKSAVTPTMDGAFEELWEQEVKNIRKFPKRAEGVIVAVAHKGGPLKAAGLNRETLITAIDGKPVRYRRDLLNAVRARAVGDTVKLTVLDAGKAEPREVALKLISLEGR